MLPTHFGDELIGFCFRALYRANRLGGVCGQISGTRFLTQTATKPQTNPTPQQVQGDIFSIDPKGTERKDALLVQLNFLWDRRRVIRRAALIGLLFGIALAYVIPARYESTTQLMPPDNQSSSGMAMLAALSAKTTSGLAPLAGDLLGMKSSGALFVGILRSSTVEDRLIDRFKLQHVYRARYEEDARKKLAENTGIVEDRKSGIISITVTDHDPKRATAIANAYDQELNQLVAELSTSSAHRERVFLQERLLGVKRDLDQASEDFSQFASKNKTIDIKEEARAMLQGAATIEGQLIAAESQLKGLQAIYTDNNVRVRAVQGRITELRHQMDKLGGSAQDQNKVGASANSGDSTHPSLQSLPLLGVTYADLYRRMQIQEAVYESLTQQFELAKVQEAKETPSVKVLDPATVPQRRSFPPRLLIMFLCAFVALMATASFLIGRQRWMAINPDDSTKLLAQQVFQTMNATMPWAPPNGSRLQAWTNRAWVRLVSRKAP
ncbi:MAG: GNVR domain-containing protein [Candidatus Acidiferrum sp.]